MKTHTVQLPGKAKWVNSGLIFTIIVFRNIMSLSFFEDNITFGKV